MPIKVDLVHRSSQVEMMILERVGSQIAQFEHIKSASRYIFGLPEGRIYYFGMLHWNVCECGETEYTTMNDSVEIPNSAHMLATIASRSELSLASEAMCHMAKPARLCSRIKLPLASV